MASVRLVLLVFLSALVSQTLGVADVSPPRLYDCFTFNGEMTMLEMRLATLLEVVDYFVIFESDVTFSGKPKARYLQEAITHSSDVNLPFLYFARDKIRLVDNPTKKHNDAWAAEHNSRNSFRYGLHDARPQDWVMLSDVDEIPEPSMVRYEMQHAPAELKSVGFECRMFYYNFKWKYEKMFGLPSMWRYSHVSQTHSIQSLWRKGERRVKDSCSHCSYCFGPRLQDAVEGIVHKIKSFSHQEFNKLPYTNETYIRDSILSGLSPFRKTASDMKFVPVNATKEAPPYVLLRQPEWAFLLGIYA
jgi:hypothetical protein